MKFLSSFLTLSVVAGVQGFQTPLARNVKPPSLAEKALILSQKTSTSSSLLEMTGGAKGEEERAEVSAEKIAGRKNRVQKLFKILMAETGLFSAVIYAKSRNPFYSVGPLLACSVCHILLGAAANDRLSSDTYKRLNLGLFMYGFIAFFAGILMKFPPIWAVSCVLTMINTVKGYGYGLKGWELAPACAKEDISNGIKGNIKTLLKIPNLKSAGYLAGTFTLVTLFVTKALEILNLIQSSAENYMIGKRIFRLSMFMILSVIMFTLKDAADRDRLEGTTFIELNTMVSLSFAAMAWEAYRKAPFAPLHEGVAGLFSAFSALNAVASTLTKNKKQ